MMAKLTIRNDNQVVEVESGMSMLDMSEDHETEISFGCRDGACGACLIKVIDGGGNLSNMEDEEKDFLESIDAAPNSRLACQCRVNGDVTIETKD